MAIQFGQAGEYLQLNVQNQLSLEDFTIEFWLKVNDLGDPEVAGGEQTIIDKRDENSGYNIRLAGSSFPLSLFAFYPDDGTVAADAIQQAIWYHVAVILDRPKLSMYLDGQLIDEINSGSLDGISNAPLRIGEFLGYPPDYLGLRGNIDDLRIWNKPLSPETIQNNIHTAYDGSEEGLVLLWSFDNKIGQIIPDLSGSNLNGQINGNARLINSEAPIGYIPPSPLPSLQAFGLKNGVQVNWWTRPEMSFVNIYRGLDPNFAANQSSFLARVAFEQSVYDDFSTQPGNDYYYRIIVENDLGHKSKPGVTVLGRERLSFDDYLVGVYYYPWWGPNDDGHGWLQEYARDFMIPSQPPLLGDYSSRDTTIIERHLDWMEAYGIDVMVNSWWGQDSWEDQTLLDFIIDEIEETNIQFSIYYESPILGTTGGNIIFDSDDVTRFVNELVYLSEQYFVHPNYLKINGRPVLYLYRTQDYEGLYKEAIASARQELLNIGIDVFLVGDEMGWNVPDPERARLYDAISPYILFGLPQHDGYPSETNYFGELGVAIKNWQDAAQSVGVQVIPNINPGFNSKQISFDTYAFPRPFGIGASQESVFEYYIKTTRSFVDPELKMLMITSWNEWHEDTQIEPSVETTVTELDISSSSNDYTQGYEYGGYGFRNLDLIRTLLSDQSCALSLELDSENILCQGSRNGSVRVRARGAGEVVSYQWSNGSTESQINGLGAGNYTVEVKDNLGCVLSKSVNITEPESIEIEVDSIKNDNGQGAGAIFIDIQGGTPPYGVRWLFNGIVISINEDLLGANSGTYMVEVTDSNNCSLTRSSLTIDQSTSIEEHHSLRIQIYPNPVDYSFSINGVNMGHSFQSISLVNIFGSTIKRYLPSENYFVGDIPQGIYFCRLEIEGVSKQIGKIIVTN